MSNEIIVMERGNGNVNAYFYYPIPPAIRIEIGGTGTTGKYPVLTPTSGLPESLLLVLTQAEKDACDAGEAFLYSKSVNIPEGSTDQQVLGWLQDKYAGDAAEARATYTHRYQYIGRRFDAP